MNRQSHARDAALSAGAEAPDLRPLKFDRLATQSTLDRSIETAHDAMLNAQHADGYWLFELEADCTIPSEYILMMHYLDEIDPALEAKIAVYLRANQADHGGWPLYYGGELDISATVKAYYALKLAGEYADQVVLLQKGKCLRVGSPATVFQRELLEQVFQAPLSVEMTSSGRPRVTLFNAT